ncbi:hypothetical protein FRC03_004676 [Tulasnella sp. 419]|nr:hypothetical protein FRC03_004676 [Tulasnella sp. 419]
MAPPNHQDQQPLEVHEALSNNPASDSSRTFYSSPHKSLVLAALLPFATIFIWSFGLGTCLVAWFFIRRVPDPAGDLSGGFHRYLLVDEGNKTASDQTLDGQGIMKSNMRGVLIIAVISNLSTVVTIPLMALGAFHVAAMWLNDQTRLNEGPTPLQFGLVMRMCSSGNWSSVLITLRYLFRRWYTDPPSARTKISALLYRSLLIAGLVVSLQISRVVTDVLIKVDLGSVYYIITTPVDVRSANSSTLGTQYNPDNGYWDILAKTLNQSQIFDPLPQWEIFRQQGLEAVIGQSTKNYIAMIDTSTSTSIQDTSYMAVIVRPPYSLSFPSTWTAPTIGMTAQCQPTPCTADAQYVDGRDTRYVFCPKEKSVVPYRSIPPPTFDYMALLNNRSTNHVQNINGYTVNGEMIKRAVTDIDPQLPEQSNPSYFVMKLWLDDFNAWSESKDLTELGRVQMFDVDDDESTWDSFALYMGACEVTMYHVEVSFNALQPTGANEQNWDIDYLYKLASAPIPMTKDETTQIFLPIVMSAGRILNESDPQVIPSILDGDVIPSLGAILVPAMIHQGFSTSVSYEFARQALAFIAGMNVTTIPAIAAADSETKLTVIKGYRYG